MDDAENPNAEDQSEDRATEDQGIDLEKRYANREVAAKLRRLADALESGTPFEIQIAGQRVRTSADPTVEIEYERLGDEEELEIEVKWTRR